MGRSVGHGANGSRATRSGAGSPAPRDPSTGRHRTLGAAVHRDVTAFWYISQWNGVVRFIRRYWTSTSRPDTISLGRRQGIGDRRPHRSANHSSEAIVPLSWGMIDETITRRAG